MTLNTFSVVRRVVRIDDGMQLFRFLDESISVVTTEAGFIGRFLRFLKLGSVASLAGYALCDVHLSSGFC